MDINEKYRLFYVTSILFEESENEERQARYRVEECRRNKVSAYRRKVALAEAISSGNDPVFGDDKQ
jgi:hypothetical protein